jgi:hypothetical protein
MLDELYRLFPLPGARPETPSSLRHRPSPTTCTRQPSLADWATQAIMAFGPGQQFSAVGRKHVPAPFIFSFILVFIYLYPKKSSKLLEFM